MTRGGNIGLRGESDSESTAPPDNDNSSSEPVVDDVEKDEAPRNAKCFALVFVVVLGCPNVLLETMILFRRASDWVLVRWREEVDTFGRRAECGWRPEVGIRAERDTSASDVTRF